MTRRGAAGGVALAAACLLATAEGRAQEVLCGQVVDMRHEPIPVARVWVDREDEPGVVLARITADGQGRFRIPLDRGDDVVRVWAASDDRSTNFARCTPSTQTTIVRLPECATLTGTLRDSKGQPVAGAAVRSIAKHALLAGATATTTTDDDGRFALRGVPIAHNDVYALIPHEGLAYATAHVTEDAEVALRKPASATSLAITVQGLTEAQQRDTVVELRAVNGGGLTLPAPLDAPQLRSGRWQTDVLPDWRFLLELRAPGFRFQPAVVTIEKGQEPKSAQFIATAIEPIELHGAVYDERQAPAPDVTLLLCGERGDSVRVVSDEAGRFAVRALFAEDESVVVRTTGGDRVVDNRELREVPRADPRSLAIHRYTVSPDRRLEVRVAAACGATGRLLAIGGRPAPFVRVALQTTHGRFRSFWADVMVTSTDASGRYSVRGVAHSDRDLRLLVADPAGFGVSATFHLRSPGDVEELADLTLTPTVTVEGVAREKSGDPAAGEVLSLSWHDPNDELPSGSHLAITDRRGRFRFVGVAPGSCRLQYRTKGREDFVVEAGETRELELVLTSW